MDVEFNVEFEENQSFDLSMGVLQFIGLTDHNKLFNRDSPDQHPMLAIIGLEDKLKGYDEKNESYDKEIKDFNDWIDASRMLNAEFIEEFQNVGSSLDTQGKSIKQLEEFKDNVASATTVEEVLQYGE